ncbi:MAG TPA: ABC transporter permease [Aggregatilinea sp.]|uniref:ABC transporter permease n=1 Tax=Aggregatilinea sp. TaxID=2806333 RepID=UPI002BAFCB4E|nr:ABC transporter permease [Aggregatilinea sp.]HML20835.1 ABC transporter permease [Aggregatilinea sp.]
MLKFLIRRLLAAIPVLFAITLVTFALTHLLPGGPFDAVGQRRMPQYMVRQLEEKFGLNKPLFFNTWNDGYYPDGDNWKIIGYHTETKTLGGSESGQVNEVDERVLRIDLLDSQFFNYVWGALHLDFGPSLNIALRDQGVMVQEEIARRLPVSMQVGVFAVVLGFLLGIPLGVLAAVYHNSFVDYFAMFFAVIGQSTPAIVLAPLLIIIFAVELGWVPVIDQRNVWSNGPEFTLYYLQILALPVITLGVGMSAGIARLTRASLLQVLHEDYVRTARAKGLRERVVIYVHALKNALIPVATILGPMLAAVLTGTFVVELIFSIPGLGKVFVDSVTARDYTMIMGVSLLYSVFLIMGNILVDIMYTWLDPRIRFD